MAKSLVTLGPGHNFRSLRLWGTPNAFNYPDKRDIIRHHIDRRAAKDARSNRGASRTDWQTAEWEVDGVKLRGAEVIQLLAPFNLNFYLALTARNFSKPDAAQLLSGECGQLLGQLQREVVLMREIGLWRAEVIKDTGGAKLLVIPGLNARQPIVHAALQAIFADETGQYVDEKIGAVRLRDGALQSELLVQLQATPTLQNLRLLTSQEMHWFIEAHIKEILDPQRQRFAGNFFFIQDGPTPQPKIVQATVNRPGCRSRQAEIELLDPTPEELSSRVPMIIIGQSILSSPNP